MNKEEKKRGMAKQYFKDEKKRGMAMGHRDGGFFFFYKHLNVIVCTICSFFTNTISIQGKEKTHQVIIIIPTSQLLLELSIYSRYPTIIIHPE